MVRTVPVGTGHRGRFLARGHTGECELQGRSLTGMAVHVAAPIQGLAGAGDILVPSTVKDIVVGSDTRFEDRGQHPLKGMPGEWRLFSLAE